MFNAIESPTTMPFEPMLAHQEMDLFGIIPVKINSPPKEVIAPQKKTNTLKPVSTKEHRIETDEFGEIDEDNSVDLDVTPEGVWSDLFLAKRMFFRMMCDLSGEADPADPDLFGHILGTREQRKQDALIWMFDLNPDGSDISFEWVCNEIGFDPERVRRITGRSVRQDLKRILKLLSNMVGNEHAKTCELNLMDYVNLSGWQLN